MSTPFRGRGGGRGRGRGGAMVNYREAQLDYDQMTTHKPPTFDNANQNTQSYQSPMPKAVYASPVHSPATSGYTTPRRGLAYAPATRGESGGGGRGGSGRGRGFDRGSPSVFGGNSSRGGRGGPRGGRGGPRGGSSGLGFSNARDGPISTGEVRPFLVPVMFVSASALPIGLEGDDEIDELPKDTPGELDDQVNSGGLQVIVRELDLESDSTDTSDASASSGEGDLEEDNVQGIVDDDSSDMEVELSLVQRSTRDCSTSHPPPIATTTPSPVPDISTLYVSDVRPSPPTAAEDVPTYESSTKVVLGLNKETSSDSEEEIVFVPTSSLASTRLFAVPVSLAPVVVQETPIEPVAKTKRPKLSGAQKRALNREGKKARKNGTTHTRSGNQHLLVDQELTFASTVSIEGGNEEESAPRLDDSDLEWGDNGPVEEERKGGNGKKGRMGIRRAERKFEREQSREVERMERLSVDAREEVRIVMNEGVVASKYDNVFVEKRGGKRAGMDAAAEDYARNVGRNDLNDDAEGGQDMSFLSRNNGQQYSIAELQDTARARAEEDDGEGWRTESDSDEMADSDDELEMDIALGEADAQIDRAMAMEEDAMMDDASDSSLSSTTSSLEIEAALLSGSTVRFSSIGMSGPGGRSGKKEKKRAKKGKGKYVSSDSDSDDAEEEEEEDESDDDEMFDGKGRGRTWADNDEDYIRGVQDILDENSHILNGRDRKNRKKLFKAIEEGNFADYDFDEDDMIMASGSKSKSKAKSRVGGGEFASSLQSQWSEDRKKKGEYKRHRAEARAVSEEASPWLNKKAKAPKAAPGSNPSDVVQINAKIRHFLMHELGQSSIALPPMSKRSRVAVHLLAEVYKLKSKSLGKGKARFPVLERGPNSGVFGVDERRIRAIVGTAEGEPSYKNSGGPSRKAGGKMGGLWAALTGDTKRSSGKASGGGGGGGGDSSRKNREGAVVGQGADRLGEGNVGYELLKRMGWTAGTQIGVSGGIDEPISARIKTNKSGLGSGGFAVTQAQANKFASSEDWKGKSQTKDW